MNHRTQMEIAFSFLSLNDSSKGHLNVNNAQSKTESCRDKMNSWHGQELHSFWTTPFKQPNKQYCTFLNVQVCMTGLPSEYLQRAPTRLHSFMSFQLLSHSTISPSIKHNKGKTVLENGLALISIIHFHINDEPIKSLGSVCPLTPEFRSRPWLAKGRICVSIIIHVLYDPLGLKHSHLCKQLSTWFIFNSSYAYALHEPLWQSFTWQNFYYPSYAPLSSPRFLQGIFVVFAGRKEVKRRRKNPP